MYVREGIERERGGGRERGREGGRERGRERSIVERVGNESWLFYNSFITEQVCVRHYINCVLVVLCTVFTINC